MCVHALREPRYAVPAALQVKQRVHQARLQAASAPGGAGAAGSGGAAVQLTPRPPAASRSA